MTVIVNISGGTVEVAQDEDAIVLDWDDMKGQWDYCERVIREVLESSLDGPAQMEYIRQIADAFAGNEA